jgi:ubiquinone/menaquinone biosynthesis C-methylase UbiE
MDRFDLTPAMLERFRATLEARAIEGVRLAEADVLELHALPESWTGYDLVVTASMLEYVPTARLPEALAGLRRRLDERGMLVLVITKRNWVMDRLIGGWWDANLYTREELRRAFDRAGFAGVSFARFPIPWRHLDVWGHIVEAQP